MMIDKKPTMDGLIDSARFKIRIAVEEDAPILLRCIKKLAHYERLSDEVTATEETFRKNLFGEIDRQSPGKKIRQNLSGRD